MSKTDSKDRPAPGEPSDVNAEDGADVAPPSKSESKASKTGSTWGQSTWQNGIW